MGRATATKEIGSTWLVRSRADGRSPLDMEQKSGNRCVRTGSHTGHSPVEHASGFVTRAPACVRRHSWSIGVRGEHSIAKANGMYEQGSCGQANTTGACWICCLVCIQPLTCAASKKSCFGNSQTPDGTSRFATTVCHRCAAMGQVPLRPMSPPTTKAVPFHRSAPIPRRFFW